MAHISTAVEYGLHCILYLVGPPDAAVSASARDLAELQGVSPEYVAKLFTRLEKAGLVVATEGVGGGFRLARSADRISVLDVVDAIDDRKPLFVCGQIRAKNALFDGKPPAWATRGVCGIHKVMLEAETQMRQVLAGYTLADLVSDFATVAPPAFGGEVLTWLTVRKQSRRGLGDPRRKKA